MNETINLLRESYDALPESLREVITSYKTREDIISTCKKLNLTDEQTIGVENETFLVLFGIELLSDYRNNLVKENGVSYDQALKISYEMNTVLFNQLLDDLKEIEAITKEVESEEAESETDITTEDEELPESVIPTAPVPTAPPQNEFLQKQMGTWPNNTTPDHMIPDHETMEIIDGPHLHSQTIMPQMQGGMGTIIDQKLSRIVKNRAEPEEVSSNRSEKYKGADPYREPIN